MAPRSAKTKKAADVKVTENDAPKKGRGKGKVAADPDLIADIELNEKAAPVADKKPKRGKKAASDSGEPQVNDKPEEVGPPAKKGRKKNADDSNSLDKLPSNGDQSGEDELSVPAEDNEQSDENGEANGHTEEAPASGRGRKKAAKKEPVAKKPAGRGRKAKQEAQDEETPQDEVEEKPKPAAKGRGRKAAKVEADPDLEADKSDTTEEEVKEKPAPKGRKRAPVKVQEIDLDEDEDEEKVEDKPEPKKKEPRGRKNQPKKIQPKEDVDDDVDEDETPSSKKRKVTKKAEVKIDDEDEDVSEEKPQEAEPTSKRRRKGAAEKAPAEEPKKKAPPKNNSATNYESIDFSNSSVNSQGKEWNFKISSWNVDGIRAWATKGGLDYFKHEKPDILCVQETKCSQDKLPTEIANIPGYHAYWVAGDKDGYAGVGLYTTKLAMNVVYGLQNEELDSEGRIITAEYEQFYLVCTYVPNSGRKLVTLPKRLQWNEEFRRHVKELDKKKPVIICGDMNVSHQEIDLTNPKTNKKNAGFTDEERAGMTELLGDGFVDTYRHLYPDKTGAYTFWTYMMNSRARNVGWRLDYFIISERLLPALCDNVIRDAEVKIDDEDEDVSEEKPQEAEPTSKRRRKGAAEKAPAEEPKKKAPPKNNSATNYESIDFSNSSVNSQGKEWNFKISSWNVDGIRAWATKGGLDYFKHEKPDILCVQETKCSQDKLPTEIANIPGYHAYWVAGDKDGYAGVGLYTTKLAMNVVYGLQNEELDSEGRIITAEYEQFYLVCTYVPNSGRKLVTLPKRLQWNEEFRRHVKELDKKKPVIICGDMNVSHQEIDLTNPKTNKKNAGFTDEERAGMTELLGDGFVDTYRHLYPDKTGAYTFWTYMMNSRARNVGWRLDYFIISERLLPALCDNVIRDAEVKIDDEDEDVSEEKPQEAEPTSKRRRKGAAEKAPAEEPKKKAPPKNNSATNYESIDFSNSSVNSQGKEWNFKISSWNVDGIRAWATKGGLDYFKHEKPDILCVQETKCSQDKLPTEIANIPGYHAYWVAGDKDGYAGVGLYTTKLAMNVVYGLQNEELDSEGRIITAEYEQFYLVCTYVPNSGRKLVTLPKRLQWNEEFRRHVKELDKKKPVIICGDMNVSHQEIDLTNPKTNKKNAGFTDEERAGMTELLGDGFVDTYRHLYPDKTGAYTFWTYMMKSRARNVGWRLDYFIISERLLPALCDNVIRDGVYGSDHCPLTLFLHLSTADKPKELLS